MDLFCHKGEYLRIYIPNKDSSRWWWQSLLFPFLQVCSTCRRKNKNCQVDQLHHETVVLNYIFRYLWHFCNIYLFRRVIKKVGEVGGDGSSIHWFIPQTPTRARVGPGQNSEPGSPAGSPHRWQCLGHCPLLRQVHQQETRLEMEVPGLELALQ